MNKFKKVYLDNGIPVYLDRDPSKKNLFFSYNVKYGSDGKWFKFNYDGKDYEVLPGHAHFLEHILVEHSKMGCSYVNFDKRFQFNNAFTHNDYTSFVVVGVYEVEKSIEDLIEMLEEPQFTDEDVESTRPAIMDETGRLTGDPGYQLVNMVQNNLYKNYSRFDETLSPIGNRETTQGITTQSLYDCYNAFYTDDRKYLIVSGDFEEQEMLDLLNNTYAKIKPHKSKLILPELDLEGIKRKHQVLRKDTNLNLSTLGTKVKKPEGISMMQFFYCMSVLQGIMLNSKEFNDLSRNGIIDANDNGFATITGDYMNFVQTFSTKHKKYVFDKLLEMLSNKQIRREDYELIKKVIIASQMRDMDDRVNYLIDIPTGMAYSEDYSEIEFYKSVGYNDFMDTISQFEFKDYTTGSLMQLKK